MRSPINMVKRKTTAQGGSVKKDAKVSLKEISKLTSEVQLDTKKLNNISTLLSYYDKIDLDVESHIPMVRKLSLDILAVFESLMIKSLLSLRKGSDESQIKIVKWLKLKYASFIEKLLSFLGSDNDLLDSFQIDCLEILMRFIKLESKWFAPNQNDPFFSLPIFRSLLAKTLQIGQLDNIGNNGMNNENFVLLEFHDSYLSKYWDLKYFLVSELPSIIESQETDQQLFFSNFLLLMRNPIYSDYETDSQQFFVSSPPLKQITKLVTFKTNFETSWINVLNFPLTDSQYRQSLLIMHKRIIPFCQTPTKLMDFLTESYTLGFNKSKNDSIVISILALNGLFELMKNYNLEYPNFYQNLYLILNDDLLHLNYKSRFFRMLDLFLSSSHLPSNLIASFIKKLSKLSLTAPPSGIVIVIPFIYNLLKKHPTCMILIHNTTQYDDYSDPYNAKEVDPLKANALESSLWEINTLMNHYHPNVASLLKIFSQPFNKYSYNLEDFLDWNYNNLLNSELTKRFKGDISLEYEKFDSLLNSSENSYLDTWSW